MANILKDWFSSKRELPTGTITTTEPEEEENKPQGADYEAKIANVRGTNSLLVPAWYRGVSLIMQTMGQMVIQYQKLNKDGGNFIEDRYGPGRNINYLLQVRPNPLMSASVMLEQIEFKKFYYGNAYVYIDRNYYGDIQALWLCTSGTYNPISDTYTITFNKPGGTETLVGIPSSDVCHFKSPFLDPSMMYGEPVIKYAMRALEISATADEQTKEDIAKGGRYKMLLQEKDASGNGTFGTFDRGRVDKKELEKETKRFNKEWPQTDAVLLSNVLDAKPMSQSAADLRILEQRGYQVADLARLLGIPLIMMMTEGGGSYTMPEHATQELMLRTIQPRIREMEDEMNAKLLGIDDFGKKKIHVCAQSLRRLDPKGQAEINKVLLETGVKTVNELRNEYDLATVEGGDTSYVSTNLAELGSDKLRSNGGGRPTENPIVEPKPEGEE